MLKYIVKRDGRVEEFNPNKLNKWAEWASNDLQDRLDWSSIVLDAVRTFGEKTTSQDLQKQLIVECLQRKDWAHNVMAGRLYTVINRKKLFNDVIPTVKEVSCTTVAANLTREMKYSDEDYAQIEKIIEHDRDFSMAHFQIEQLRKKYAIQNRLTGQEYELPQFVYMRMAMALAEDEAPQERMMHLQNWYNHFSLNRINAPSPNYVNLGTNLHGYASCCLYVSNDTARSIAAGDHIAYVMTYMSAGIGGFLNTRSIGDSVRGGAIVHQGKLPYLQAKAKAVKANLQAGRGGALTEYYSVFDPEAQTMMMAQNPRTTVDKQNRDLHFCMMSNRLLAKKVAKSQKFFLFNVYTAPDLMEKFFSGDQDGFEALYHKYEADPTFAKTYVDARQMIIGGTTQSFEVGTHYLAFIDEMNRHTSFKEPIYSGNLCIEITQPAKPYERVDYLYKAEDHGKGEVSLCSIAAINVAIEMTDEEYASASYYALRMIDKCIRMSDYELPHVGYTAVRRMNAAVGMLGVATALARRGIKYSSQEGKEELHRMGERHSYFVIEASLKLGQELGNAEWMHKTKWPDGWLPIDTYKKQVDQIVSPNYNYDWENLRARIIANGGIRNSSLVGHMPTESSSKASGAPNCMYPVRDLSAKKTDGSNAVDWCAIDGDILGSNYESAWKISSIEMIKCYAVIQKFADLGMSCDLYKDRSKNIELSQQDMIDEYLAMVKFGLKGRYYQNSLTSDENGQVIESQQAETCVDGACKL